MHSIVIASGKGGSGKTTLTAHLAVQSGAAWVIDTDRQATLAQWHERRAADTPERLDTALSQLRRGLETLASRGTAYCFIDTAPAISEQTTAIIQLADLVLIPVRPSPADLWAVGETVATAERAGKPFLFIVSQVKPQALITAQAVAALSQHGRVAGSFIVDRVAYASAMTGGNTAPELWPNGPTALEISRLWADVKSCLDENIPSRKSA